MLFRKKVARFCSYCANAGQSSNDMMLCSKKGFVSPDGKCWRFRYDPLKRTPSRYKTKDFTQFKEEDFLL